LKRAVTLRRDISPLLAGFKRERRRMKEHAWKANRPSNTTILLPADWGLPTLRLRSESLRDFFAEEIPLRVTFQTNADGQVSGLLIHPPRGQKAIPAKRAER
jgi:hypothetical protein